MGMARLIDADALQLAPDPWGGMNGVLILGRRGGKEMTLVQSALKCMIDNAPTIDAVPVVRCKDCVKAVRHEIFPNSRRCKVEDCRFSHKKTHFCSYGERKNDE